MDTISGDLYSKITCIRKILISALTRDSVTPIEKFENPNTQPMGKRITQFSE